jgi:uncharacterized protein YndB with AHSA1/START domain
MPKTKTLTLDLSRVIAAPPVEAYDAWMDPARPCNPWNHCKKLILSPKVDGLFFILGRHGNGVPHFGRFTALARGRGLKHTWMSPVTRGLETEVTVRFKKQGLGTLMTLRHSGLPDDELGRTHQAGWTFLMGLLEKQFRSTR